ncbi:MAG: glucose 1-dehydrogenase [Deltaproteobacteria bacterium]|nr:glucose 1-dehydrogenase [Deltaproteobacteria bacterium]
MGKLDNQVAVITGGASGIGKASVELFIKEGARVVVADIIDDYGQSLADEMGENAVYLHTDVSQEDQIKAAVDLAVKKFGRLDCMFNNAGIPGASGPIDEIPSMGFDITIAILFRSVFYGMKQAAPIMKEQGSGSIINTASIAGYRVGFGGHFYSACKAAVIHMTRSVAIELGPFGVRVNCICPGAIVTSIFARAMGVDQKTTETTYEPLKEVFKDKQSIKRAGMPHDIAQAAVWLASEDTSFVNGADIKVDGGFPDGIFTNASGEDELGPIAQALGITMARSDT